MSPATAFRAIGELRKQGIRIESVKRGREWYFEVLEGEVLEKAWTSDPLLKSIGFIARSMRKPGQTEDDLLDENPARRR